MNSARCPQCDADLTCFQALDSLAEEKKAAPAEEATGAGKGAKRKSSASSRRAVLLLLLLLVLLGSILFFLNLKAKARALPVTTGTRHSKMRPGTGTRKPILR